VNDSALLVLATRHFVIRHVRDRVIPGYLIIAPIEARDSISELSLDAQRELGTLLASCGAAISKVVSPERIYFATFSEEDRTFHMHVSPRTEEATAEYVRARNSVERLIRGPLFFDWARDQYRGDAAQCEHVRKAVTALQSELQGSLAPTV
jgi:diadenosine tetraphosphate (Ap4A) HIT family hydrolase